MGEMEYGCTCGALRGRADVVGPKKGVRLVCMCDDCQAFLIHLGREELLDEHRGTEVLQTSPKRVAIDQGEEHLRLLRLSPRGTLRWYAGCCNTPLGNQVDRPRLAFVSLPFATLHPPEAHDQLGPVYARIQARYAPDPAVAGHPKAPARVIARCASFILGSSLRGHHRPSPFRDADGNLTREPEVLTREQVAAAKASVPSHAPSHA